MRCLFGCECHSSSQTAMHFIAISFLLAFLCILIIIAGVLYIYATWNFSIFQKMGVQGPKPLPFLGTRHHFKNGFRVDKEMIKKYGRVFGTFEGVEPVLVICDAELIKLIGIKEFDSFPNHRRFLVNKNMATMLSALEDDDWRLVRGIITPTFSGGKLKKISSMIDDCTCELIENLCTFANKDQACDLKQLCHSYSIDVTARILFAIDVKTQKNPRNPYAVHVKKMADVLKRSHTKTYIRACFPFLKPLLQYFGFVMYPKESVKFFMERAEEIIGMRAVCKENPIDLLQFLLDAHKENDNQNDAGEEQDVQFPNTMPTQLSRTSRYKRALTKNEILANIVNFEFSGSDTTATTTAYVIYCLAMHQDVQEKLYEHLITSLGDKKIIAYEDVMKLQYLDQVVCESQRLHFPAARLDRYCKRTCQVGPYTIPKGMVIHFAIVALHHDEEYWPDPYRFDPDRFSLENRSNIVPYTFFPFGVGPRNCVALRLGLLIVKMAVARMLLNFKFLPCDKSKITLTSANVMVPMNIWVKAEKRIDQ